ncbi:MAG: three-Cys-motif partner protein TcmP [Candidatus Latescibacteria bacterium]|nr:three-Cys-motif partner protein TcmP [Candidatus Latescibacterota bacterium]
MNVQHQFGGQWTEQKLDHIKKYLHAYRQIFSSNPKASYFNTTYVDAFAGPGFRNVSNKSDSLMIPLYGEEVYEDEDAKSLQKGSVQIALETKSPFDNYIFIDKNPEFCSELKNLRQKYPEISNRITIACDDANTYIQQWCNETNWRKNRAVVFLDPYGMEVSWATLESIAKTEAIDLWILFPLGSVNRMLTKKHHPEDTWCNRLTSFFGTEDWKKSFYKHTISLTLFGEKEEIIKDADFNSIEQYFIDRLKTIFFKVAKNPLKLRNSMNSPIFLLCFAAGNHRGAPTAIEIAQHILRK